MCDDMRPAAVMMLVSLLAVMAEADDQNNIFTPCDDAKIQVWDGFTFGIAISSRDSFFSNGVQLSPCDSRLSLSSNGTQLAVFCPKINEISLLTIDGSGSPWVIMQTVEADVAFGLGTFDLTSDEVKSRVANALKVIEADSNSQ